MRRRRVGLPKTARTTVGQKLMALVGLALVYGGGVTLALAAGVSATDLETFTRYRTVYDRLAALDPADWSDGLCIAVGVAGVLAFLLLVGLGWAQRLLPQLGARDAMTLPVEPGAPGLTTISARAIERAAEIAASLEPGVHAVKARLGDDDISLALHARDAARLPELLRGAQERARAALAENGTPQSTVRVTVTRFTAPTTREQLR